LIGSIRRPLFLLLFDAFPPFFVFDEMSSHFLFRHWMQPTFFWGGSSPRRQSFAFLTRLPTVSPQHVSLVPIAAPVLNFASEHSFCVVYPFLLTPPVWMKRFYRSEFFAPISTSVSFSLAPLHFFPPSWKIFSFVI